MDTKKEEKPEETPQKQDQQEPSIEIQDDKQNIEHSSATSVVYDSSYTEEQNDAYKFAYEN
jgi:hypothetical protein